MSWASFGSGAVFGLCILPALFLMNVIEPSRPKPELLETAQGHLSLAHLPEAARTLVEIEEYGLYKSWREDSSRHDLPPSPVVRPDSLEALAPSDVAGVPRIAIMTASQYLGASRTRLEATFADEKRAIRLKVTDMPDARLDRFENPWRAAFGYLELPLQPYGEEGLRAEGADSRSGMTAFKQVSAGGRFAVEIYGIGLPLSELRILAARFDPAALLELPTQMPPDSPVSADASASAATGNSAGEAKGDAAP